MFFDSLEWDFKLFLHFGDEFISPLVSALDEIEVVLVAFFEVLILEQHLIFVGGFQLGEIVHV